MSEIQRAIDFIMCHVKKITNHDNITSAKKAINLILNSDQIFVYGVGRSGIVGRAFAMRLVQMGLKAYFIGETITPIVNSGNTVILISKTGETMSAIKTAEICKNENVNRIVITADLSSQLAKLATEIIHVKTKDGKDKSELAPLGTLFEISALIFLDGIVAQIMKDKGETEKSMSKRHAIMV